MNWIEIAGFITGVAGVWLTIKENVWCWPIGLVNVILYIFFFLQIKLYADMWLQVFYVAAIIYGWWQWTKDSGTKAELKVSFSKRQLILGSLLSIVVMTFLFGYIFSHYTDAALPWWDSLLTAMSLVATWMTAKKKIENWIIWFIADFTYVIIYILKDAYLTAILYFIFFILAVLGYREWKASWRSSTA